MRAEVQEFRRQAVVQADTLEQPQLPGIGIPCADRINVSLESVCVAEGNYCRVTQLVVDGVWRDYILVERIGIDPNEAKLYDVTVLEPEIRELLLADGVVSASRDAEFSDVCRAIERCLSSRAFVRLESLSISLGGGGVAEWFGRIADLARRVEDAIDKTRAATWPLVLACEQKCPGHYAGTFKFAHMEELTRAAPMLGLREGLTIEDTLLLRLVARLHDIGRHIEFLQSKDPLRSGIRHGYLSAEFALEKELLSDFFPREQEIITGAVAQHAERQVTLTPGSAEWRICYLFRDQDKGEIMKEAASICRDPAELFRHVWALFLNDRERQLVPLVLNGTESEDLIEFVQACKEAVSGLMRSETAKHRPFVASPERAALLDKFCRIMNAPVSDAALQEFFRQETISVENCQDSQSACVLATLALVFDVCSPSLLHDLHQHRHLEPYLDYLKVKLKPELFERVQGTLEEYFVKRLAA